MKINNKGYASTIIMFSILTLFLISMLMLVKTMSNSSTLNKKITEKVVDNINYDASGTVQDQIAELNTTITSMQNQIDNIKGEVINEIYPVGSIYMSTEDDTIEKVQSKFGGIWEKYASGTTLISSGIYTKSDGNTIVYKVGDKGGSISTILNASNIPNLSVKGTTNSTGNGYSINYTIEDKNTSSSGNHIHNIFPNCINCTGTGSTNNPSGSVMAWYYYMYSPSQNSGMNYLAYDKLSLDTSFSGGKTSTNGSHSHTFSDKYVSGISGILSHSHTFTGNYVNNNVKEISIQNPYTVVYMYKRAS